MYSRLAKGEFCKYCNFVSKLGYVDVSQRICCFLWGSSSALFHTIIPKLFHVPCASAASSAWCMCKSTWSFPVSMLRIKFISWPGSAINFIICFARVEGDSSNIPFIQNKRNGNLSQEQTSLFWGRPWAIIQMTVQDKAKFKLKTEAPS